MQTFKRFIKNYKISIPVLIVLLIIIAVVATQGKQEVKSEFITAARTTVAQEVSVTGRVVPAEEVNLAIQSGGKVTSIPVAIGQEVTSGQTLLRVDSSDLQIRLGRQQASLEKAQLALGKQEPKTNAEDDLKEAYEDGFNTIADTFLDLPTIITTLDSVINDQHHSPYLDNENLRPLGTSALDSKRELTRSYGKSKEQFDILFAKYKTFNRTASPAELEAMINATYDLTKIIADTVKQTRNLVDYVENRSSSTSAFQTYIDADQRTLDGFTAETNTHLSGLLSIKTTIKDSQRGITDESSDVESSRIDIRQAELDIQDTLVQIGNRTIKAPSHGIVTKLDAKVGETISPGSSIVSVISANQFEIEANIPEADIAKIALGADVDVTLDAYGSDVVFKATVVALNPAETILDGVATYKATFQFTDKDERIKSGMTASLIVKGERKENVIAIPQRAVVTKDAGKFVEVMEGDKTIEKKVEIGLRGSDGSVEIISGINEGDKVIIFSEGK